MRKYLTLAQNTSAACIFLNLFNLILEEKEDIDEFTKLKIYDRDMNIIGELYFNNGVVIMNTSSPVGKLNATFPIAEARFINDTEGDIPGKNGSWVTEIKYQFEKLDLSFSGEVMFESSVDTAFGLNCLCHPTIHCERKDLGKIDLMILRDGNFLNIEILKGDDYEQINIKPFGHRSQILHDITYGKLDEKTLEYPYRYGAGVFDIQENGIENKDYNLIFIEKEYDNFLKCRDEYVHKNFTDDYRVLHVQQGTLMQQLDPSMYNKLAEIKKIFTIGDTSFLDNLISICYDSYTDEEIKVLLGCERCVKPYQNGSDKLTDAYFGIGKNSIFLPLESQTKLLNKKR